MFYLEPAQIRQLLGAVNLCSPFGQRDYLLILFLYETGLRVGECSSLTIGQVYTEKSQARQWLHLPAGACKGSRGRVVPLNQVARACVDIVPFTGKS